MVVNSPTISFFTATCGGNVHGCSTSLTCRKLHGGTFPKNVHSRTNCRRDGSTRSNKVRCCVGVKCIPSKHTGIMNVRAANTSVALRCTCRS